MADMSDVRSALWNAYDKLRKSEYGIEGKSSEAYCELMYPAIWDCEVVGEFLLPSGIMIYSYALGPSRRHYINRGQVDREVNYYTWESPCIYKKAIEIINMWAAEIDT